MDIRRYELLKASGELPSPRGVALQIIRLTQAEDVPMAALRHAIKADPAFAGRLIKAANSARAEHGRPVASVEDALLVLGLAAVRALALGFSLLDHYRNGQCTAFDYGGFWSHSVLLGLAMQELVRHRRILGTDEAFSLGLVARVGELALATLYPQRFARVIESCAANDEVVNTDAIHGEAQFAAEQAELGLNHAELSAAMLADWGMPQVLVQAVLFHERPQLASFPPESREQQLLDALSLSSLLARTCLVGKEERPLLARELLVEAARCDIETEQVLGWCEQILAGWDEWRSLLELRSAAPDAEAVQQAIGEVGNAPLEQAAGAEPGSGGVRCAEMGASPPTALLACLPFAESEALTSHLAGQSWVVEVVNEADRVLAAVAAHGPKLMIIDCNPDQGEPDQRRLELVRDLRQMRNGEMLYVLAVLQEADEVGVAAVLDAGVDDLIVLPLRAAVLRARLQTAQRLCGLQGRLRHEQDELKEVAAALMISNRRLEEAAMTDVLTGLPNRRYAVERMAAEWAAARRGGRELAVMIVDLDNFKEINDRHGHDAGDLALQETARALRDSLRVHDVICRTGGDEFLVICPGSDLDSALLCAERMRDVARSLKLGAAGLLRVSTSIGVAGWRAELKDVDALLKLADRGAYLAKDRGRNTVVAVQALSADAAPQPD